MKKLLLILFLSLGIKGFSQSVLIGVGTENTLNWDWSYSNKYVLEYSNLRLQNNSARIFGKNYPYMSTMRSGAKYIHDGPIDIFNISVTTDGGWLFSVEKGRTGAYLGPEIGLEYGLNGRTRIRYGIALLDPITYSNGAMYSIYRSGRVTGFRISYYFPLMGNG